MTNLKEFYPELIESAILIVVLVLLSLLLKRTVRNFTKKIERLEHRTGLIMKHIDFSIYILAILGFVVIWGLDFTHLGVFMSSIFAVIGIAFFAQWSILSNITSGVIMFFTFPYKIGDYIVIHDKEAPLEGLIEDIKTFHIILHTKNNEIITYPNSMMLQKGVIIIRPADLEEHHHHHELDKNKDRLPHD